VGGFSLALVEFLNVRKKEAVERSKLIALGERIEHSKYSIAIVRDTVDLAVQRAKANE
jgi:hypothetical protein